FNERDERGVNREVVFQIVKGTGEHQYVALPDLAVQQQGGLIAQFRSHPRRGWSDLYRMQELHVLPLIALENRGMRGIQERNRLEAFTLSAAVLAAGNRFAGHRNLGPLGALY